MGSKGKSCVEYTLVVGLASSWNRIKKCLVHFNTDLGAM